jgi:hypothetical protein
LHELINFEISIKRIKNFWQAGRILWSHRETNPFCLKFQIDRFFQSPFSERDGMRPPQMMPFGDGLGMPGMPGKCFSDFHEFSRFIFFQS